MSYFLVLWLFLSLFSLRALSPTFGFSLSILGNLGFVFFLIKDLFFVYLDNLLFTRFEIINFLTLINSYIALDCYYWINCYFEIKAIYITMNLCTLWIYYLCSSAAFLLSSSYICRC